MINEYFLRQVKMLDSLNEIILAGTAATAPIFDHTVLGERFYLLFAAVRRLSGYEDVLPVTVSESLLPGCEISPGARLFINGEIRSYTRFFDGRNHLVIRVFAKDLAKGAPFDSDVNETRISGRIAKPVVYRTTPFSREIADVVVAVDRGLMKRYVLPAIAWGRNARNAELLKPGDAVRITGRLQSREYIKRLPDDTEEKRTAYEISCASIERFYS